MENKDLEVITVTTVVNAPLEQVWKMWTSSEDIVKWNAASDDWHTIKAENDLQEGGKFSSRMEAKDGSMGFDFSGTYTTVTLHELIEYTADDNRKVQVYFANEENKTKVIEKFEAESQNPVAIQKMGWQAILDNFKKYTEASITK